MAKLLFVVCFLVISSAMAFNMMKTSSLVKRQSLSMSPLVDVATNVLPAKADMFSQALLVSYEPGVGETLLGFLFIATAIMGSLQDFLARFDKK